jgi:hypothetical protein
MKTIQLNIRLTPEIKAKIVNNARLMGQRPAEYARSILAKEEELITGAELHRRVLAHVRARKKEGRPMSLKTP